MGLSIGQVSKKMNISTYTLRYYEKEGLLPFVHRDINGVRVFEESDLDFLRVIDCLKRTGMPLQDIRRFIRLADEGDGSLQERYELFMERRDAVDRQIEELQRCRECIDFKCEYYRKAVQRGSERGDNADGTDGPPEMPLSLIIGDREHCDVSLSEDD